MTEGDEVLLQSYLDGELPEAEAERVRMRIASQPEWAQAEQRLRDMLGDVARGFSALNGACDIVTEREAPAVRQHRDRYVAYAVLALAAAVLIMARVGPGHESQPESRTGRLAGNAPAAHSPSPSQLPAATPGTSVVAAVPPTQPQSSPPGVPTPPARAATPTVATPTIEGARLIAVTLDRGTGVVIEKRLFALGDREVVTLETTPELRDVPRGMGSGTVPIDTTPTPGRLGDENTLTWRNGHGIITRLRGKLSADRLAQLRNRVRR